MKILVIGGMHGNETLGIDVVKMFEKNPVENVETELANPKAIKQKRRFIGKDLNRSFPGKSGDGSYEDERAELLLERIKNVDVALDFHNTFCPNNDCSFVGEKAQKQLYNVSGFFGLQRVIVADYACVNKYASNCISIEISMDSPRNNAVVWYALISALSRVEEFKTNIEVERYKFLYRMTLEDKKRFSLEKYNLSAFQEIDTSLATAMNVASPTYPIFINDAFTPYNYGGLLGRID